MSDADDAKLTARYDFALDKFRHYASYSPIDGTARSFLVSLCRQRVRSHLVDLNIDFEDGDGNPANDAHAFTPWVILERRVTDEADAVHTLRRAAPGAVAATKQLLRRLRATAPDLRAEAAIAFAAGLRGPEAAAGLAAFAKKQPAPWAREPDL